MVDIAKATKTLEDYFAVVTKEQFSDDLRKFCPELFGEEEEQTNGSKDSLSGENDRFGRADAVPNGRLSPTRTPPADRQLDLLTHSEVYQEAKEDNKIEIAAKLLHKGISVKEVAEILELDINSIA